MRIKILGRRPLPIASLMLMGFCVITTLLLVQRASPFSSPSLPAPGQNQPATTAPGGQSPGALPEDGPAYPISAFELRYVRDNPDHPPIQRLMQTQVELGWTWQGYVAPRADIPSVKLALEDAVNRGTETYYASAIQRILERLRDVLNSQGLIGVYVAPDPLQISPPQSLPGHTPGQDLRQPSTSVNPLTLVITTGIVKEMRTLASGERVSDKGPIKPEDRINNPVHQRILDRSPIQPYHEGDPLQRDLLRKDLLDEYLFFLSRHPGRRVDASLAAGVEPGTLDLDYQVTENRPLTLYAQFSNTGTRSTNYWRERFGLTDTQLTNHDDVLSLDYITSWFDKTNSVIGSYEAPFSNDRIRWRIEGNWSEFTADEVGFFDEHFSGNLWSFGGELIANVYQHRELFIDVAAGARFEHIHVNNRDFGIEGDADFGIPHVGVRLDRSTEWFSTQASAELDWWLSGSDQSDLAALGRTAPDENPTVLQWSLLHAVYLEPLLNRREWEDPTKPESATLCHEVQLSLRGQCAFGNRLIPQAEEVAGGLYTVRGYPESIVAGDSVIIGSAEYRYHIPRAFGIESEPRQLFGQPFRYAPQYVYGRPDWDLILKAFIDAGRTINSDRLSFEHDETLVGVGIGAELQFKRNLNVRVDWGFALEDLKSANVQAGDNRVHFVATILF